MAAAIALSLLLATLIFLPVIGAVGVSEFGGMALGEGEIMRTANATMATLLYSNTYVGIGLVLVPIICVGAVLVIAILYLLSMSMQEEVKTFSTANRGGAA